MASVLMMGCGTKTELNASGRSQDTKYKAKPTIENAPAKPAPAFSLEEHNLRMEQIQLASKSQHIGGLWLLLRVIFSREASTKGYVVVTVSFDESFSNNQKVSSEDLAQEIAGLFADMKKKSREVTGSEVQLDEIRFEGLRTGSPLVGAGQSTCDVGKRILLISEAFSSLTVKCVREERLSPGTSGGAGFMVEKESKSAIAFKSMPEDTSVIGFVLISDKCRMSYRYHHGEPKRRFGNETRGVLRYHGTWDTCSTDDERSVLESIAAFSPAHFRIDNVSRRSLGPNFLRALAKAAAKSKAWKRRKRGATTKNYALVCGLINESSAHASLKERLSPYVGDLRCESLEKLFVVPVNKHPMRENLLKSGLSPKLRVPTEASYWFSAKPTNVSQE